MENKKKNYLFLVAGVLSIIESVGLGIALIVMIISPFAIGEIEIGNFTIGTTFIWIAIVFIIIALAMAIYNSVIYFKYTNNTYEENRKNSTPIITAIVFSFIISGILVGLIALFGYTNKPDEEKEENVIYVEPEKNQNQNDYDNIKNQLDKLKKLKDNSVITEEEYDEQRKKIIEKL